MNNSLSDGAFAGLGAFVAFIWLFAMALSVIGIISVWKIFKKAGKNGWEAIVPIYNVITLFQIVGINPIWVLGLGVPILQIVILVVTWLRLTQGFGKSGSYVAGLILLPIVFLPMLAFGKKHLGSK